MAAEFVMAINAGDVQKESSLGYNPWAYAAAIGSFRGLRLQKNDTQGYTFIAKIPGSITLATGLTFTFGLVDNAEFAADPGKNVMVGITVKRLAAGNTLSMDTGTGLAAEVLTAITTQATSGTITVGSVAIALASLPASLAIGDRIGVRFRRNGSNAGDTFQGSVTLTDVNINNT